MKWNNPTGKPFPKDGSKFISFREEFNDMDIVCWEASDDWEEGRLMNKNGYYYHPRYCSWWSEIPNGPFTMINRIFIRGRTNGVD